MSAYTPKRMSPADARDQLQFKPSHNVFLDAAQDPIYREFMDSSGRLWPRADLRVGDVDRQAVVDELQRHYVAGRLNSDELGDRVAETLNAKTFADLALPLVDLPQIARDELALATQQEPQHWEHSSFGPPLGAVLVIIGAMILLPFLLPLFMSPGPGHHHMFGLFGFPLFWPLMIWGFFFMGRSHRGGRRRW